MTNVLAAAGLFVITAFAEIAGCYLPDLWLCDRAPIWVLAPAALSLALFVYLLTLHPTATGRVYAAYARVYAAYGGAYVATALVWLWLVDGVRPTAWDMAGVAVAILGVVIIVVGARTQVHSGAPRPTPWRPAPVSTGRARAALWTAWPAEGLRSSAAVRLARCPTATA